MFLKPLVANINSWFLSFLRKTILNIQHYFLFLCELRFQLRLWYQILQIEYSPLFSFDIYVREEMVDDIIIDILFSLQ
jgi:hypothetical protein